NRKPIHVLEGHQRRVGTLCALVIQGRDGGIGIFGVVLWTEDSFGPFLCGGGVDHVVEFVVGVCVEDTDFLLIKVRNWFIYLCSFSLVSGSSFEFWREK